MHIMDAFKSVIDQTRRRAAYTSTRHGDQSLLLVSMLEGHGAHSRAETPTHTFTLFFHEIHTLPIQKIE